MLPIGTPRNPLKTRYANFSTTTNFNTQTEKITSPPRTERNTRTSQKCLFHVRASQVAALGCCLSAHPEILLKRDIKISAPQRTSTPKTEKITSPPRTERNTRSPGQPKKSQVPPEPKGTHAARDTNKPNGQRQSLNRSRHASLY